MNEQLAKNTDTVIHDFNVGDFVINHNDSSNIYEVITYAEWMANGGSKYTFDLSTYVPVKRVHSTNHYPGDEYNGLGAQWLKRI